MPHCVCSTQRTTEHMAAVGRRRLGSVLRSSASCHMPCSAQSARLYPVHMHVQAREIARRTGICLDRTERVANSLGKLAGMVTRLNAELQNDVKVLAG